MNSEGVGIKRKVVIMGAAGRDFHNFNVFFRGNSNYEVVCFTAEQIPNISGRKYPSELAGHGYPHGIPIESERELPSIIKKHGIDIVVMAYSDVSNEYVMDRASSVNSLGPDFVLMGAKSTMIKPRKPVISVCAVRTGCGKSQTTRKIGNILREKGVRTVVIRHPMPYGDLRKQEVQRFADYNDLLEHECTIEEREEYEQHIKSGMVVYAGVDYGKILEMAEKEADVMLWDGGNNDIPFYVPDLHVVVADPHRPEHGTTYYPGAANLKMADVVVINKENTAKEENIEKVTGTVKSAAPRARIIHADSVVTSEDADRIKGKKVLVVEDGPTITHGGMPFGAGWVAAKKFSARELVKPERYAVGSIRKAYEKYAQIREVLPALGYGGKQIKELEKTINRTPCDLVVVGTPMDLRKIIKINKPSVYVEYNLREKGKPALDKIISEFLEKHRPKNAGRQK